MTKISWDKVARQNAMRKPLPTKSWADEWGWMRIANRHRNLACLDCKKEIPLGSLMRWYAGIGACHQKCFQRHFPVADTG